MGLSTGAVVVAREWSSQRMVAAPSRHHRGLLLPMLIQPHQLYAALLPPLAAAAPGASVSCGTS